MEIAFTTETDRAGLSGIFLCSSVFIDSDAIALGETNAQSTALCYWRNSTTLVARFGPTATVLVEDSLTLRVGVIGALADPTVKLNDGDLVVVSVSAPDVLISPVPVIDGTSAVGWCDTLTLDASASYGGAGRPFVSGYRWGLVPPADNSTDIVENLAAYLASQWAPVVSIDGAIFDFNTTRLYNFSLTLTNWLGEQTTAYYPVEIIPSDQVVVRINGVPVVPPSRLPLAPELSSSPPLHGGG